MNNSPKIAGKWKNIEFEDYPVEMRVLMCQWGTQIMGNKDWRTDNPKFLDSFEWAGRRLSQFVQINRKRFASHFMPTPKAVAEVVIRAVNIKLFEEQGYNKIPSILTNSFVWDGLAPQYLYDQALMLNDSEIQHANLVYR
jgi:hypothetical protein